MSKCKQCSNEVVSTGNRVKEYCSDACRKKWNRTQSQLKPDTIQTGQPKADTASIKIERYASYPGDPDYKPKASVTPLREGTIPSLAVEQSQMITPEPTALDHYYANPDMYVTRNNPELLNWGKPMLLMGLQQAGLKANRVPIPGDHDYAGCCEQVEGKWQVKG